MSGLASKDFLHIILFAIATAIYGSSINFHFISKLHSQIEITTDKMLELPIFNETQTEQSIFFRALPIPSRVLSCDPVRLLF